MAATFKSDRHMDSVREPRGNALVLGSPFGDFHRHACADLLTTGADCERALLLIHLTQPGIRSRTVRERIAKTLPERVTVINVGPPNHESAVEFELPEHTDCEVVSVPSPSNLTATGTRVATRLQRLRTSHDQVAVCFRTLTTLLQYVPTESALNFVITLMEKVRRVDGFGHYHLHPSAHDAETIDAFRNVADTVVEPTEMEGKGEEPRV